MSELYVVKCASVLSGNTKIQGWLVNSINKDGKIC